MRFSHRIPISYTAVLQEESIENAPFCHNHLFLIAFVPSVSWQNRSFSTRNWQQRKGVFLRTRMSGMLFFLTACSG
jgi:hypothetical protein